MARILIVDDNALFRSLLQRRLEQAGHQAVGAAEGEEALRLQRQQPADVILCDLFMPGKEGLETIRELRQTSQVPVIAMTGDGPATGTHLLAVAAKLGADRTLAKPIDFEVLLATLREVLPDRN